MKTAKMTIRLPDADLAFAKRYAREQGLTLTDLILRYIDRLSRTAKSDIPAEVRAVAGAVAPRVDARTEYRNHLMGKHS